MKKDNYHFKRVLITGATGFIGSHLLGRLSSNNQDLAVIVRSEQNKKLLARRFPKIRVYRHNGTTEAMLAIFKEERPEIVFHLASLFLAKHSADDLKQLLESNIVFGTQLLEAMVTSRCYNLVNTGTAWQHFRDCAYDPVNLYAATKQAFEDIMKYYFEATPLKSVTLKLYDTYGRGDQRPKILNLLKTALFSGHLLKMSPGRQLIDLVYVDDVIDAYLLAAKRLIKVKAKRNESYAVSSGKPMELRKLVKLFSQVAERAIPVQWGVLPYREREVMRPWQKGRCLPGWQPKISLSQGIREFLAEEANERR